MVGLAVAMQQENVDVVKQLIPPSGTDYTSLFRDDVVWAALKDAAEPLVEPDVVVAFVAWGQELMKESAGLYVVRKGRIVRADYYAKQAEALEAVGLSERDVP